MCSVTGPNHIKIDRDHPIEIYQKKMIISNLTPQRSPIKENNIKSVPSPIKNKKIKFKKKNIY